MIFERKGTCRLDVKFLSDGTRFAMQSSGKWCPGASSNAFCLSVTYEPVGHFYFLVFTYVCDESVPLFLHPLAPLIPSTDLFEITHFDDG